MRPLRANTFLADRGARLAGSHACPPPPPGGQVRTAPAENPKPPAQAGAVTLSEASAFILSLVAAHEGRAPHDILAELIAAAADAIGIHSLLLRDAGQVDLADVPDFALRAANRFRGGGP